MALIDDAIPVKITDFKDIEVLFLQHSRSAYGLAIKILQNSDLAEDAVQEAFLKLWKNPTIYNSNHGPFINWVLVVVRNICLDYLRKKKRLEIVSFSLGEDGKDDWDEKLVDPKAWIEEEVFEKLQRAEIQTALKVISKEQRTLIELAFFKRLTHYQIAAETGLPIGTVKSRIRQGLLKLKVQLDAVKVVEDFNLKPSKIPV